MMAMTCDQCREIIAVADLTDWGDMDAVAAHCRTCETCAGVVTEVRDSARRVADLLDGIGPGMPAALVARRAAAQAALERQQRRRRRAFLYPTAAAMVAAAGFAVFVSRSGMRHYPELHLPLRCLGPEQATTLVMPIVGREGTVAVKGMGPHMLTISGPREMLQRAEHAVAQYDNEGSLLPGESCLLPAGPPNVGMAATMPPDVETQQAFDEMIREQARLEAEQARRTAEEMRRAAEEQRHAAEEARRAMREDARAAARKP
ncbi:hypothetical protein J421_1296 [Gemmatirosa kalamazoonensis]|uniref:Zinc-finger domain-containing protein n=1 Tax=Gemmatirosa kalamazoonensis TaxID=861299 RepID=W0RHF3_9BACT|nr:hypothetical protein [Gemmatirosa kalamazoonensis]AHG88833.1 hypothetical protein J421_1296 [Gemmatirosa kalamazoonensis]